jgi:hypothetical protein
MQRYDSYIFCILFLFSQYSDYYRYVRDQETVYS